VVRHDFSDYYFDWKLVEFTTKRVRALTAAEKEAPPDTNAMTTV